MRRLAAAIASASTSLSSASSASGRTSTPTAEVWMRPADSVTGTRCTRWTPASCLRWAQTPSAAGVPDGEVMATVASRSPPSSDSAEDSISTFQPRASAYPRYIRSSSARSEEHTSELQSRGHLVCRLLLEKAKHEETQYNNAD